MKVETFCEALHSEYYAGVPDSQLKALCNYLMDRYNNDPVHHIIAANEGNATALAAGYYLSTGKIPVVYMQNSGIGNTVNPVMSLLNENVYGIPCIFVVGWRGEPGVHDEPQHVFQGEMTIPLLQDMGIETFIVRNTTGVEEVRKTMQKYERLLQQGKSVAFIVAKDALSYDKKVLYENKYQMLRETAIEHIVNAVGEDIIVSTTGKASRELFEIRERKGMKHGNDFLTVGSMGHSSSIALEIALQKPDRRIWCIDGDGALIMHMGAMAIIGNKKPCNMIHVIINNEAHETVGGMPTVMETMDLAKIAIGCGYQRYQCAGNEEELKEQLRICKSEQCLTMLEIKAAIGARADLGRPTMTPRENGKALKEHLTT